MTSQVVGLGDVLDVGFYRFTLSPPSWIGIPTLSVGKDFQIPLTDYHVKITKYEVQEETNKLTVEVEVYTLRFLNHQDSYDLVENISNRLIENPWKPRVRTSGGYVKGTVSSEQVAMESPTAVPQVFVGAILGIIGLGVLYFCLDKVEKLVESPTVGIGLIGALLIGGFLIYKNLAS